ncbi:BrxE family protein [Rhizobium ruizarguesonis]|uniref:BrxE family protein n=1 Tax=Rhizobium ruizarguesonis TaxID=2081791 RepID=UPI002E11C789|nr:BrxE family protein [Rhizobium ruizarguesonis]WSH34843.1 BrxE family protein [Rhizobium ruizarguesonis]
MKNGLSTVHLSDELPLIENLLTLRLTVGFLGERNQHHWWPSSFFEASARLFLDPTFPKTANLARYHGVVEAARRTHDEHLNVGSYHLFRLPEEMEQNLHDTIKGNKEAGRGLPFTPDKDAALAALMRICGDDIIQASGPYMVGSIGELEKPSILASIASAYVAGFRSGLRTLPYLVG